MASIYLVENFYNSFTVKNLERLIKSREKLAIQAYHYGDIDAVEYLIDIDAMLKDADFTEKQAYIVDRLYIRADVTQEELAKELGITQQGVMRFVYLIRNKLKRVKE